MERQVRVLIADDQGPTRQALRALLTLCPQVEVVGEAIDGREAVNMVATRQPDVVLMDMQMPVMDGAEATRQILELQSNGVNKECAIVGLSAHAGRGDRSKYLGMGMVDYLTKPIDLERLKRVLEECIPPSDNHTFWQ